MPRAEGCIFVDTNSTCLYAVDGRCTALDSHRFECLAHRLHTKVHPDMRAELHTMLDKEIDRQSRNKNHSGQLGRKGVSLNDC